MNLKQQCVAAAWLLVTVYRCSCFHDGIATGNYDGFGPDDVDIEMMSSFGSEETNSDKGQGKEPGQIFVDLSEASKRLPKQGFLQKSEPPLSKPKTASNLNQSYLSHVEHVLDSAGLSTPPPEPANAPPKPPTPEPYHRVKNERFQPLDTRIGAALLYESAPFHFDNTPVPPPSTKLAVNQFFANCPMVLFERKLKIFGSDHCGETGKGKWVEPKGRRNLLRWERRGATDVFYGVDSALSGPGSVMFAAMNHRWTFHGIAFEFVNCMEVGRWLIDEQIIKVNRIGNDIDSTFQPHSGKLGPGYFIKYVIRFSNFTAVAESNLFRAVVGDQVNFTTVRDFHKLPKGSLIATAQRVGSWHGKGWRCNHERYWQMEFPQDEHKFDTLATAADLRVATSAIITLMAQRDETRDNDALLDSVQDEMNWYIALGLLLLLQICCVTFVIIWLCRWAQVVEKLRKFFFTLEAACLPRRPFKQRAPVLHTAY